MSESAERMPGLEKGLLSDQIYAMIRGMITDSTLEPGHQLVESRLARQLQVSQSPVREALRRLAHDGLVTQVRHHGSFVADHSRQDAEAAKTARVALEEMAGRFACGRLDQESTSVLESLIDDMSGAAARADVTMFRELDFAFHRAVIAASGNSYLPRMWDVLEPSLRSLHVLSDPDFDGDWGDVAEAHRDLLRSLENDRPQQAADKFRRHASGDSQLERRRKVSR
jgi:DNA-binding GntR family transcriptional regulator